MSSITLSLTLASNGTITPDPDTSEKEAALGNGDSLQIALSTGWGTATITEIDLYSTQAKYDAKSASGTCAISVVGGRTNVTYTGDFSTFYTVAMSGDRKTATMTDMEHPEADDTHWFAVAMSNGSRFDPEILNRSGSGGQAGWISKSGGGSGHTANIETYPTTGTPVQRP